MRLHLAALGFTFLLAGAELPAQGLKDRGTFRGYTFRVDRSAISPDGKILAAGGGDTRGGDLKLWDVASGAELGSLPGYSNSLQALAFSPDGKRLASTNHDYKVTLWDVDARKQQTTFKTQYDNPDTIRFSQDGKRIAWAGYKQVQVWDLEGNKLSSFTRNLPGQRAFFRPDLKILASVNYQEIDLLDTATGKERLILSEHRGAVHRVAFDLLGKTLISSSVRSDGNRRWFGQVKLWDVATGKETASLKGDFQLIWDLALSPDGKTVALLAARDYDADVELRVLEVASSRILISHKGQARSLRSIAYIPDGRLFVTEFPEDTTVKLWEVK